MKETERKGERYRVGERERGSERGLGEGEMDRERETGRDRDGRLTIGASKWQRICRFPLKNHQKGMFEIWRKNKHVITSKNAHTRMLMHSHTHTQPG